MSGRRAGAGEPGSRGARAAPSHIAAMQLFHELKQQFPALPDHAVSACIAQHLHDPSSCHSHLQQASIPRSLPYPVSLRLNNPDMDPDELTSESSDDTPRNYHPPLSRSPRVTSISNSESSDKIPTSKQSIANIKKPRSSEVLRSPKMEFRKSSLEPPEVQSLGRSLKTSSLEELVSAGRTPRKSSECPHELVSPKKISSSVVSCERISPTSPSDVKDFSPFSSKPPMSPSTSKKPPGRASKPYDARIVKLPEDNLTNAIGTERRTPAVRPASLDLPRRTSDCVDSKTSPVQGVKLSVNVNCSVGVVEQGNGSGARRHSAVLEVTPEPTWLHTAFPPSPRSYTSVNLTLRTPTTSPQGPIDICSSPAPASLTYTTSSFDRRQGLQSRLQITVGSGPGVGSVTATRTRPRSCYQEQPGQGDGKQRAESMPDLSGSQMQDTTNHVVLLSRQKERKEQLRNELNAGKERLHSIQKEIQALRLENTPEYRTKLKKDIRHLQAQCERLTREVDRHSESRVPLGETNEEFYRHIYTGQRPPSQRRRMPQAPGPAYTAANEPDNEPRWPCHICTFRNHPLMDKCEQCEMPRVLLGKIAASNTETPTAANGNPPHANTPLALGMNS